MLVLTRKAGESVEMPSLGIRITVHKTTKGKVTLGVEAPMEAPILRGELCRPRSEATSTEPIATGSITKSGDNDQPPPGNHRFDADVVREIVTPSIASETSASVTYPRRQTDAFGVTSERSGYSLVQR